MSGDHDTTVPITVRENWAGQDFLKEADFSDVQLLQLIDLAAALKHRKILGREVPLLNGKNVALIFAKTSTRTRCAFEVAAYDQGAHVTYIDPQSSQLGHKESIADTAQVLSRFYDAIEFRGSGHQVVEQFADAASVPVYNGLTDTWHPTQMLADFLTMREHSGGLTCRELSYAYLGDSRHNMGNSLLVMGAIMGSDVRLAAPKELWPSADVQALAQQRAQVSGARILLTEDPVEALRGAQFVHTDVWVSMGEPADVWAQRVALLRPYRVDEQALRMAGIPDAKFMHCLPAFHDTTTKIGSQIADLTGLRDGIEVSDAVFRSPASIVFDQAENRLHTIKALLVATLQTV